MRTGNFVVKHAKQLIPDTVLELMIEKNPHGWSLCGVSDGKVISHKWDEKATLEQVKEYQESMKDFTLVLFFANHQGAAGSTKEDIEPFTLMSNGEEAPVLAAYLDGDFSGYAQEKSSHSDAFFAAQHLQQNIDMLKDMSGSDIEKIVAAIEGKAFEKTLFNMSIDASAYCFVAAVPGTGGKFITRFDNPEITGSFEWGVMSHKQGYFEGKAKQEEKPAEVKSEKKDPFASMMKKGKEAVGAVGAALLKAQGTDKGPVIEKDKDDKKGEVHTNASELLIIPDEWSVKTDKDKILNAYRMFAADKASYSDWKKKPAVRLKAGKGKEYREYLQKLGVTLTTPGQQQTEQPVTQPDKKPALEPVKIDEAPSTDVIKDFKKNILPRINESSVEPDPVKLIAEQDKRKTFAQMVGVTLDEAKTYPYWAFNQMCHQTPDIASVLMDNLRAELLKAEQMLEDQTAPGNTEKVDNQTEKKEEQKQPAQSTGKKDPFASMMKKAG